MTGELNLRAHDLPPKWDGRPVEWEPEWQRDNLFICPPTAAPPCPGCGRVADRSHRTGTVTTDVGFRWRLTAYRCVHCGHDEVHDHATDTTWGLDTSDYGDAGSWPS